MDIDTTVIPTETPIIAPIIPPSPDYTPASPDYSHASETESDPSEDPSSGHVPPLPAVSPFLSSDDDTTDNSSSRHSLSDHSSPDLSSTSAGLSRKRRRSSMTSVGPRETRVERVTHHAMLEDIPEPAQEGAAKVTYETLGDLVQRFHDHTQAITVHRIQAIEGVQREKEHRGSMITALTERVNELERDHMRLRVTASVESQRNSALTWWNSHKRTIGVDAAYAMKWAGLMKLMTKVYCSRNEV
nr:reverse transcriptase domain-containing protein [Tanacetum cinerariifolium]